jgi:hypothetical protein
MRTSLLSSASVDTFLAGILLSPYTIVPRVNQAKSEQSLPSVGVGEIGTRLRSYLGADLSDSCGDIVRHTFEPRIAAFYRFSTSLPVPYWVVPGWLRSLVLERAKAEFGDRPHATLELAREQLVTMLRNEGEVLREKRGPMLIITHDIDTEKGFRKAVAMKSAEAALSVNSIWFIPADQYHMDQGTIRDLSDGGTIGSHDTKHDGKLIHLRDSADAVRRLRTSRERLEYAFEKELKCFRSPLLQFSGALAERVKGAGYTFDFSLPSWEPAHPSVMGPFGIEYYHSFSLGGLVEVPLSTLQDHQALYALRLSTHETVSLWIRQAESVLSAGGDVVLLIHPDYKFSDDLDEYRRLIAALKELGLTGVVDLEAMRTPEKDGAVCAG